MYQALYRKWRPRTFDDVVGQTPITETLKRQIITNRLSHAYLFTGTRGTGKTSCAKILARVANCTSPVDGNPCNQCPACLGIENGSILDVLELDAASNNGVDHVRALRDEAIYSPAAVAKRVYIVDEVHMLSTAAFNALLKILEEPPAHLMFILATTELHKVPATIKSRCQQFSFQRIQPQAIAQRLGQVAQAESIVLQPEAAELLSRLADGGLRDGLSLLDQCAATGEDVLLQTVLDTLGLAGSLELTQLMEHLARHDCTSALEQFSRLYQGGRDISSILGELATLTRDLLLCHTAPKAAASLLSGNFDQISLTQLQSLLPTAWLSWALGLLQHTLAEVGRSHNPRYDGELCLIRLCDPRLEDSLPAMTARLAQLEAQLSAGLPCTPLPQQSVAPVQQVVPKEVKAPAKPVLPPVTPPPQEDRPPWDIEPPPAPVDPPAPTQVPNVTPQPAVTPPPVAPPAPVKPAPAVQAPATAVDPSRIWTALLARLQGKVPRNAWPFLSNPSMVQGRYADGVMVLWAMDDMVKNVLSKPKVGEIVAQFASAQMGCPVRVQVQLGQAPAIQQEQSDARPMVPPPVVEAPKVSAPVQAEHDFFDDLVAFGQQSDRITIK